MNRLDSSFPSLLYSENSDLHFEPGSAHRLIILIPADSDYTSATRRLSDLAHASGGQMLLLGLYKHATQEPSLRRHLITLSALLQNARLGVESKVEVGTDWVDLVTSNDRDGDLIVCFAEQRAGLLHRPLGQLLQSNLYVPIYILSGSPSQPLSQSSWRSQTFAWTGAIGIIIGFFILQVQITSVSPDWMQTTLLILSVIGETWLIGIWNSLSA